MCNFWHIFLLSYLVCTSVKLMLWITLSLTSKQIFQTRDETFDKMSNQGGAAGDGGEKGIPFY